MPWNICGGTTAKNWHNVRLDNVIKTIIKQPIVGLYHPQAWNAHEAIRSPWPCMFRQVKGMKPTTALGIQVDQLEDPAMGID